MHKPYRDRIAQLQKLMRKQGLSSMLVTSPVNWSYLTGFTGEAGILLIEPQGATLITDGRFTTQARQEAPSVAVVPQKDGAFHTCGELLKRRNRGQAGFDSDQVTVGQLAALRKTAESAV